MASSRATRYARAIFDLARDENDFPGWADRLERLRRLMDNDAAVQLFTNPMLTAEQRVENAQRLAKGNLDEQGSNLGKLLASAGAITLLDEISDAYTELVDAAEGRVRATAVSAVELSKQEWDRIARELSQRLRQEVKLEVRVDPEILGGLRLEIGDKVVDGTVAGRLQQLRRALVAS